MENTRILCKEVTRDFIQKTHVGSSGEHKTKARRNLLVFFGIPSTVFLNHVNFALWAIRRNTFLVVTLGVGLGVGMKYCYRQQ